MSQPTAISLFSGIGGIDLAFSLAGFDVIAQVEIDPFCRKVLAKHAPKYWPNAVQFEDVKSVGRSNLPAADVIFGGFPCQDISVAGNGEGIKEGTRSGLWYEFRRIIGELRPRFVFLENVPAITGNGGTLVAGHLTALGYDAEWCVVPATSVGATHRRERWYCVAYPCSIGQLRAMGASRSILFDGQWNTATGQQIWRKWQPRISADGQLVYPTGITIDLATRSQDGQESAHADCAGQTMGYAMRTRLEGQGQRQSPLPTITQPGHGNAQSDMGRILNGLPRRLDAVRRVSRFPAGQGDYQHDWEAPRTAPKGKYHKERVKALGNAVVPQVIQPFAEIICDLLQQSLFGVEL